MKFPKRGVIRSKKMYNDYRQKMQGTICIRCESAEAVEIHHITFKSQGGSDVPQNLAPLCRDCHNRAHGINSREERIKLQILKGGPV